MLLYKNLLLMTFGTTLVIGQSRQNVNRSGSIRARLKKMQVFARV